MTLVWEGDRHLVVDDVEFMVNPTMVNEGAGREEAGDRLVLKKPRWLVERYVALRSEIHARNILELGIYEGGSAALMALLFQPRRLVAIDLEPDRVPMLDSFIERRGLRETLRPYFGTNQADRARLEAILEADFAGEPLDLVVDDASHLLGASTVSFNVLFPRLRPGGLYVLEDWSWKHDVEAKMAKRLAEDEDAREGLARRIVDGDVPMQEPHPMSRLLLQLVIASAYAQDLVEEVLTIRQGWAVIRRGPAPIDPATFNVERCVGGLGASLLSPPRLPG